MDGRANIKIIQFKGFSKSGKTTAIEAIIRYLKDRNLKVAAIKNIHAENFSLDEPGKNTWRMSEAGADPVISLSSNETAFITRKHMNLDEIISISKEIAVTKIDYIIAEGFWESGAYPLVLNLRVKNDFKDLLDLICEKPTYEEILSSIFCISGVYIGKMDKNNELKNVKHEIIREIENYNLKNQNKLSDLLCEKLKRISLLDIRNHPDDLIDLHDLAL
jgi:molybdopterin-guanine dinucleotide biosynthesis protein MobB